MKRKTNAILILMVLVSLISCKKDSKDDNSNNNNNNTPSIKGRCYVSFNITPDFGGSGIFNASYLSTSNTYKDAAGTEFQLETVEGTNRTLQLWIQIPAGASLPYTIPFNSYVQGAEGAQMVLGYSDEQSNIFGFTSVENSGSLIVSYVSGEKITGTFSCKVTDALVPEKIHVITNGEFIGYFP